MASNKRTGRFTGFLLILIFILGILIYQFYRGPFVFADNFLTSTSLNANKIITSSLLGVLSGTLSIIIAVILLPIFHRHSSRLAYLYLSFCLANFVAISIESYSALSLLEISNEFINSGTESNAFLQQMGNVFYENHRWAHYTYLLISCLPVFVLYYTLFYANLVPNAISIFGMIAVFLMGVEVLSSMFDIKIGIDLMIPMGLIQLFLPFWLMVKGFKDSTLITKQ